MAKIDINLLKLIELASCKKIRNLCKPLKLINLTYFLYVKRFNNNREVFLTNNQPWSKYFYENDLYEIDEFSLNSDHYQDGLYLWSTLPCQKIFKYARLFNIDYGFTIVEKNKNFTEYWHFGCPANKSPTNLNSALNNMDLIRRFMSFFKCHSHEILLKVGINIAALPLANSHEYQKTREKNSLLGKELDGADEDVQLNDVVREQFMHETNTNRYYLMLNGIEHYLTRKEMLCLEYLKQGMAANEIAEIMSVSKRTVETHIDNIKAKTECHKQFQLGYLLAKAGLI